MIPGFQEAKMAKLALTHDDAKLKAKIRAKAEAQQRLVEEERKQRLEDQQRGIRMHRSIESLPAVATNQREEPTISAGGYLCVWLGVAHLSKVVFPAKAARMAKAEKYRRKVKR
jgi:hypothetical protein